MFDEWTSINLFLAILVFKAPLQMEIQTSVIHVVLCVNLFFNVVLLQPYLTAVKKSFLQLYMHSSSLKTVFHILNVLYVMIAVVFCDSIYKYSTTLNKILEYQSERNLYLSAFALFLSFNLHRLSKLVYSSLNLKDNNKYIQKQHKDSGEFLKGVIDKYNKEQEANTKLSEEIKSLKKEIESNKQMISEIENNKKAYLTLKDKYEKLSEKIRGETKKNK